MYLTPDRFRTMGLGIDLTGVDDVEIRSVLQRSSALADSYCSVPLLPQKFDFRGGTMTDEQHEWSVDAYDRPGPYRYWPWAKPVRTVTSFRIYSTPNVYTAIDPQDIFINNSGGWIEVSSLVLTQFGIFGTGVVQAIIGMYHPVAQATYTYGWQFPVVDEVLEPTDALTYQAQNQWWLDEDSTTVKVNDVEVTTGFTIDLDEGAIVFDVAQSASDVVTASYTYKLPWQIAQAVALIAADDFGDRELRAKGMTGIDQIQVGEISLRRTPGRGQRGTTTVVEPIAPRAQELLSTFVFRTVR